MLFEQGGFFGESASQVCNEILGIRVISNNQRLRVVERAEGKKGLVHIHATRREGGGLAGRGQAGCCQSWVREEAADIRITALSPGEGWEQRSLQKDEPE